MSSVFIIAEAGVNHGGDLELAFRLVDAAIKAKADAVKFQTFKAENVISIFSPRAEYQIRNMGESEESQLEMTKKLELKLDDFIKLKEYCDKFGIIFLTTPFDFKSADFIYDLVDIYKIPSGEVINLPFLEHKAGSPAALFIAAMKGNWVENRTTKREGV